MGAVIDRFMDLTHARLSKYMYSQSRRGSTQRGHMGDVIST